jgi:hypothetical protein
MGDVVNLRKARKLAGRREHEKRATENRLAHGRSKAERTLEKTRRENADRLVQQHKLTSDNEP